MIENRIGWWKDISDTPSEAFAPEDDVERTRPLSGVVELRKLAAGINYLQLTSFKQKDDDKGIISVEIEKDKLLQLTQRTQKLLGLDEYIQPEETAEVVVSAKTSNIFLRVIIGEKRVEYYFNPEVTFLAVKFQRFEDGEWILEEERPLDDYKDPKIVFELFENKKKV
ncbi:MAG: hypothetical protein US72_C0001G0087 [Microgenomates group bacterium GW2011_GWC1_38_12]|nr:MAG: hypothetical protein US72_C0001G0087 [Microgenomates group bacterium GW2011_GWC1_38_12]